MASDSVNRIFTDWMSKLSGNRLQNMSLLDIPAMFSVVEPGAFLKGKSVWSDEPRSSYSSDGLCDAWTLLETYARDWECYLNGCPNYALWKNVTEGPCFSHIDNLFMDKLELVMKLMKYSVPGTKPRFKVQFLKWQS